ncbi:hypothetical protein [Haliscomenobacter sp.]|uniref:hypothetical protein n=1 Tax=Haliscomenobacter sp. TaxID=2717303 RepID=UPI003BAD1E0C
MPQQFIFTALPWKNPKTGQMMISAHVSIQLSSTTETTLQSFPDLLKWPRLMEQGRFTLYFNDDKQYKVDLEVKLDRDNYEQLFNSGIKVRSYQPEDLGKLTLNSFPEKHIASFVQDLYKKVGNQKVQTLPDENFLSSEVKELSDISEYELVMDFQKKRPPYSEADFVQYRPTGQSRIKRQLSVYKAMPFSPTPNPQTDFAQVRIFNDASNKKNIRGQLPEIRRPDFEYHDILAVLSSHPDLLRRFGLVIDLVVPEKALKDIPSTGFVRVAPERMNFNSDTKISCPATAYQLTPAGFYAQSRPESSIDKGCLKINSADFAIVQIDANGAALKLAQQMDNLMQLKGKQALNFYNGNNYSGSVKISPQNLLDYENEKPREAGLPALRSAGLAVVRNGLAAQLNKKWVNAYAFSEKFLKTAPETKEFKADKTVFVLPAVPTNLLYADDLVQGYRMDIQAGGKWYSLHRRLDEYVLDPEGKNIRLKDNVEDEGFIQLSVTQDTQDKTQLRVGEVLARWEGWSLSVPRPGKALNNPRPGTSEVDDSTKDKYLLPKDFKNFRLQIKSNLVKGTLPKLRFGNKYRIKIRTVDLAGNSLSHEQTPENPGLTISPEITYQRFDSLPTPALVLGNEQRDGESMERMVVRSNGNVSAVDYERNNLITKELPGAYPPYSERHIKAPRAAQLLVEQHGLFDKPMSEPSRRQDVWNWIDKKDQEFNNPSDFTKVSRSFIALKEREASNLELEYIADPMAMGIVFCLDPESPRRNLTDSWTRGKPHFFSFYQKGEISDPATLPALTYEQWQTPKSLRIRLEENTGNAIKAPVWDDERRILTVYLPKGEMAVLRYASFWRPADLQGLSGVFAMLNDGNPAAPARDFALKSLHWMVSPWRRITLVHALQQPLTAPSIVKKGTVEIEAVRKYGDTTAALRFQLKTNAASTEKVALIAGWNEYVDDLSEVKANIKPSSADVQSLLIGYNDDTSDWGSGQNGRQVIQAFQDTKHRKVRYTTIATTRYREYFTVLAQQKKDFPLVTKGGVTQEVSILSTARPAVPLVEYVIPSFNWLKSSSPGKSETHIRTANVQVYLKRPWFSSGEEEMLGVVLAPNNNAGYEPYATLWGQDPIYVANGLNNQQFPTPDLNTFPLAAAYEKSLTLAEVETVRVATAAYQPLFDEERQLYYANVPIATGKAYFPFVKLALTRYQKNSLRIDNKDCCLSGVVHTDWIQLPAPRTVVLNYSGGPAAKNKFSIGVAGPVPVAISMPLLDTGNKNPMIRSRIRIAVETPTIPKTDEAFISILRETTTLWVKEFDIDRNFIVDGQMAFNTGVEIPDEYKSKPFRVIVEEYELVANDPVRESGFAPGVENKSVTMGERLVFLDVFEVNGVV